MCWVSIVPTDKGDWRLGVVWVSIVTWKLALTGETGGTGWGDRTTRETSQKELGKKLETALVSFPQ